MLVFTSAVYADESSASRRVYTLTAPYLTITDEVPFEEIKDIWIKNEKIAEGSGTISSMGQKVNPISNRLGIVRGWDSNWFGGKDFGDNLVEDQKIRKYLIRSARQLYQGKRAFAFRDGTCPGRVP